MIISSGNTISNIKPIGGLVAGQPKKFEIWTEGTTILITDPKDVKEIDDTLLEAKKLQIDAKKYLEYRILNEEILKEVE